MRKTDIRLKFGEQFRSKHNDCDNIHQQKLHYTTLHYTKLHYKRNLQSIQIYYYLRENGRSKNLLLYKGQSQEIICFPLVILKYFNETS